MAEAPYNESEKVWAESQKDLGDTAWAIETGYESDFAFAYFNDTATMTIAFKGRIPSGAASVISESGLPFEVLENVGFNQTDYDTEIDRITEQLVPAASDRTQFSVEPTPRTTPGRITITIRGDAGNDVPAVHVAQPFSLTFETSDEIIEPTGYNRAAGTWLIDASGVGQCTSGFVVQSTTGSNDLGVLTAGHCINDLRFYHIPSGENYWLSFRNETYGLGGDVQFNRSALMMDAWFHVDATTGRPVLGVRNSYLNELVCRFGKATDFQVCAYVRGTNVSATTTTGVTVGNLDYMDVANNLGDSGGSVYGGNTAMGLMHGRTTSSTYFTRISAAQAVTGTRVCLDVVCS